MNRNTTLWPAVALGLALAAASGAQQSDDAPADAAAEAAAEPVDDETLAAEDAAVDEVLADAELVYEEDEDTGDFIPSEQVSADQSLDYPIDI